MKEFDYSRPLAQSYLEAYFTTDNPRFLEKYHKVQPFFQLGHNLMLQDRERLEFYRDMIKDKVKDKIILDVGAGTGILTHLCLKYCARKVYSIERQPLFQDLFSQFLKQDILAGKAVLIAKDACEVKLDDLGGVKPDLIIHELIGSGVYQENIIPVFQSLSKAGILIDAEIIPNKFSLKIQPISCPELLEKSSLPDFEDFPFHKMEMMGSWTPIFLDYIRSRYFKIEDVAESQTLYLDDLYQLNEPPEMNVSFNCQREATHLHIWLEIYDGSNILSSNHQYFKSHWFNYYFPVPAWISDKKNLKASFEFIANRLVMKSLTSIEE